MLPPVAKVAFHQSWYADRVTPAIDGRNERCQRLVILLNRTGERQKDATIGLVFTENVRGSTEQQASFFTRHDVFLLLF